MPARDCFGQAGQLGSSVQRVPPRHVPAQRGVHELPRWDLLENRVGFVPALSRRDVFRGERDAVHGLCGRGLQQQEQQHGVPDVRGRLFRGAAGVDSVLGVPDWVDLDREWVWRMC